MPVYAKCILKLYNALVDVKLMKFWEISYMQSKVYRIV